MDPRQAPGREDDSLPAVVTRLVDFSLSGLVIVQLVAGRFMLHTHLLPLFADKLIAAAEVRVAKE